MKTTFFSNQTGPVQVSISPMELQIIMMVKALRHMAMSQTLAGTCHSETLTVMAERLVKEETAGIEMVGTVRVGTVGTETMIGTMIGTVIGTVTGTE